MNDLLHRFRFPLTYLLLATLSVIQMASARPAEDFGFGAQLVLRLTLPLERMVTSPIGAIRGVWVKYVDLVGVREDNEELKAEVVRLREENLQYREAIVASERFQRLSAFRDQYDVPLLPANVVAHDVSRWFRSVILDRGTETGVRPGMPVITDFGVVGVVAGTTPRASKVLLVTDPQSRIDAYVQRSRARGTVRGKSREECELEYVLRDADVQDGDLLLTTGLGEIYPRGLVIGRIQGVERKPYGLFQSAEIKPMVDFRKLEEVFVILERKEIPDADAFLADLDSEGQAEPRE